MSETTTVGGDLRANDVRQFKLPDVGEGLTEADIVKWHVRPGDHVEVNQTIVEIETAKAIVELPCPYEGVVTALHVDEGQTVDVGVPIISVDLSGGEPAGDGTGAPRPGRDTALNEDLVPSPAADPGTLIGPTVGPTGGPAEGPVPGTVPEQAPRHDPGRAEAPKRTPVLVGYGVKPGATKRRPRKAQAGPGAGAGSPTGRPQPVDDGRGGPPSAARPLAKPPVRKLARTLGVDLNTVPGTGPQGSITRQDLLAAAGTLDRPSRQDGVPSPLETPAETLTKTAPTAAEALDERIPVRGVRKQMAASMVASAFTAPHVTEFLQVDVTETMQAVRRLRELPDFAEVKVTPLLLVAKALLLAVRRHPMINSSWNDDEIIVRRSVNLGIAAATERGLIVPNVKNAQDLSLVDLAKALTGLAETARTGRTPLADLTGGTISITNVGVFGVDTGTPILPPGEAAILAFGQVRDLPWVHEGEIKIRKVTTLALSFDHRIVDGELGSAVLRDVGAALEDPLRLIAWS